MLRHNPTALTMLVSLLNMSSRRHLEFVILLQVVFVDKRKREDAAAPAAAAPIEVLPASCPCILWRAAQLCLAIQRCQLHHRGDKIPMGGAVNKCA